MTINFIRSIPNNSRLILILAGWGSDLHLYSDVEDTTPEGWDILCISDFDNTPFPDNLFTSYHTIYLYAWSLGVAAASLLPHNINITRSFALAGTPLPVNERFGIPVNIFEGTRLGLNPRNLAKFRRRMVSSADEYKALLSLLPEAPNIEDLKSQLLFFKNDTRFTESEDVFSYDNTSTQNQDFVWSRAYITLQDAIFPPENQSNYWEIHPPLEGIISLNSPHYFPIKEIIKSTIHNPAYVGRRFQKALDTYNPAASPQRKIAEYLINLLPDSSSSKIENILEIGHGSGLLTKMWGNRLNVIHADFIDLYPCGPFNVAKSENYLLGDAEKWMENTENMYDCILSANTMQWFANPLRFISNAYAALKPGGILLLSSFLPGNLYELDSLRPCPMAYKDFDTIKSYVENISENIVLTHMEITAEFNSVKEALVHLKNTGVGIPSAVNVSSISMSDYASALATTEGKFKLTYKPIFIRLIKPE